MSARKLPPILGVSEVADLYGVSRQLAMKWSRQSKDWPSPFAVLKAGTFWTTDDVLAWGKRHERKPGEGPRATGDPRPPSARRRATKKVAAKG